MSRLTIKLFGPPRIELDGVALDLDHRKPVALLAYLAVTNQMHTRDALAALLWPEYGNARTYLRNNLWIIRQALGEWAECWLESEREVIGLKPAAPLWLDVAEFQRLLTVCQAHGHPIHAVCQACLTPLTEAASLAQAEFLAGFTLRDSPAFDEWQFFQRESLRRTLADLLVRLAQHHKEAEEFAPAIQYVRRWLALNPLHEPAHRTLMQLYAAAGEYAAAVRQYQTCQQILQAELQGQPDAETQTLYRTLQTHHRLSTQTAAQPGALPFAPIPTWLPPTWQLLVPAAPQVVMAQAHPPNNLFEQLTSLVGRRKERSVLQAYLRQADIRLVTLTGTGGIGKTRLALQVAADLLESFADGAYFVPLAPIREANLVIAAIAQILGVQETGSCTLIESVIGHLQDKTLLLVLDNFEHVVSATPLVTDLLARCPRLKILVTSREVLRLRGEHEYSVPALAVPTHPQTIPSTSLSQYEAVQLFIERAQVVKPDFAVDNASAPAVAEICVRLDGLPLAIELAAARCKFFSPQVLLQKLTASTLATLRGGARDMPERHQTLRNAIAWSYDLLNVAERRLFQQLAVFVGDFTLEAAEQICTLEEEAASDSVQDGLLSLVDKSLVRYEGGAEGAPRFLLLETIREFALEQLQENGKLVETQRRHASYYAELANTLCHQVIGPHSAHILARIRTDFPNIRTALQWLLGVQAVEESLQLCSILFHYWNIASSREALNFLEAALTIAAHHPPTPAYVNTLATAGFMSFALEVRGSAQHYFERCLAMNQAIGNLGDPKKIGFSYGLLGWIQFDQGDYATAQAHLDTAKENDLATGDKWALAMTLSNQGNMATRLGEFERARHFLQEALTLHRQIGEAWGIAHALINQGFAYVLQNKFDVAAMVLAESQKTCQEIQAEGQMAEVYRYFALIALHRGEQAKASRLMREALLIRQKAATPRYLLEGLETATLIAVGQNDLYKGLVLAGAINTYRKKQQLVMPPVEKKLLDEAVALAHQRLTVADAETAWAIGAAMTLEEAVAYALAG